MTDSNAEARDAAYLACQLRTNASVTHHRRQVEKGLAKLHEIYLEVAEEEGSPLTVTITPPRIDTSQSRPRLRSLTPKSVSSG